MQSFIVSFGFQKLRLFFLFTYLGVFFKNVASHSQVVTSGLRSFRTRQIRFMAGAPEKALVLLPRDAMLARY